MELVDHCVVYPNITILELDRSIQRLWDGNDTR